MNKQKIVLWTKRFLGAVAILFWLNVVYKISKMSISFMEQAPYCMGTTMLIFGILTALYKSLDYWVAKRKV